MQSRCRQLSGIFNVYCWAVNDMASDIAVNRNILCNSAILDLYQRLERRQKIASSQHSDGTSSAIYRVGLQWQNASLPQITSCVRVDLSMSTSLTVQRIQGRQHQQQQQQRQQQRRRRQRTNIEQCHGWCTGFMPTSHYYAPPPTWGY